VSAVALQAALPGGDPLGVAVAAGETPSCVSESRGENRRISGYFPETPFTAAMRGM
jgi:hypothetical protein